jgi:hypothetical protein
VSEPTRALWHAVCVLQVREVVAQAKEASQVCACSSSQHCNPAHL